MTATVPAAGRPTARGGRSGDGLFRPSNADQFDLTSGGARERLEIIRIGRRDLIAVSGQ